MTILLFGHFPKFWTKWAKLGLPNAPHPENIENLIKSRWKALHYSMRRRAVHSNFVKCLSLNMLRVEINQLINLLTPLVLKMFSQQTQICLKNQETFSRKIYTLNHFQNC
jgi:hypothetical protein